MPGRRADDQLERLVVRSANLVVADEPRAEVDDHLDAPIGQDTLWARITRRVCAEGPIAPDVRRERRSGTKLSVEH
jgi:hypothetical protein